MTLCHRRIEPSIVAVQYLSAIPCHHAVNSYPVVRGNPIRAATLGKVIDGKSLRSEGEAAMTETLKYL